MWQHKQKIPTHTHRHTRRRREEHAFSPCQGHSTSIAAMIIMFSSNEGATRVYNTRLFPLTQPVITTFCLSVRLKHTQAAVVCYVILSQSQPCHPALSLAWQGWQGCPKTGGAQKELAGSLLWHGWGCCAADEVCTSPCPPWLMCQRCCLSLSQFWNFARLGAIL